MNLTGFDGSAAVTGVLTNGAYSFADPAYVTIFVTERRYAPAIAEAQIALPITLNGPQPLTGAAPGANLAAMMAGTGPIGFIKFQRASGPITFRGFKGTRTSTTGTATVELYAQSDTAGAYGATPYPGLKLGTLSFANGGYSAPIANWAQDPTLWPSSPVVVTITDPAGVGTGATAVATVNAGTGAITALTMTNSGGNGYSTGAPPTVTITGGAGTGATGTANVNAIGAVSSLNLTNGGSGYVIAYPDGPVITAQTNLTIVAFGVTGNFGRSAQVEAILR